MPDETTLEPTEIALADITVTKFIAASPEDVFDAWIDVDAMKQWMGPGTVTVKEAAMDVRVGGKWSILMQDEDKDHPHWGAYRIIDRPRKLEFSWISPNTQERETIVTIDLKPSEGGTNLTLTHRGLPTQSSADGHKRGWTSIMEKLAGYCG